MAVPFIYIVALCTAIGGFTFGYDTGVINGILTVPLFQQAMGITKENSKELSGNIASMLQLGGFVGALFQPTVNDYFGRKISILINCVIFSIGAIMQSAANNLLLLYVGRFTSGFAVSIMAIAISMYNAEVAPSSIRGRIVGLQQFMVAFGIATAYWVNYGLSVSTLQDTVYQYSVPLGLQLVPPIILFIGLLYLPRSPRWLAMEGRLDEAREALAKIRELEKYDPAIDAEMKEISDFLLENNSSTWSEVFSTTNLPRLFVGVPLILFQQFAGQNIINYYSPSLFKALGITGKTIDLLATGLVGITKMVITIPALYAVDRFGRRPLMIIGTSVMALSFYYIGFYSLNTPNPASGISAWGYIAIFLVYIFMSGYAMSWGIIHYVLPAEIYPQNIRAKAGTLGGITDWLFQFVSIKIYPLIIDLPNGGIYFLSAGLLTIFLVWIFICLPETKGLRLEQIDVVFSTWKRWKPIHVLESEATRKKDDKVSASQLE